MTGQKIKNGCLAGTVGTCQNRHAIMNGYFYFSKLTPIVESNVTKMLRHERPFLWGDSRSRDGKRRGVVPLQTV